MIDPLTFLTIVLMATVTYAARIGGYLILRNRTLGARATAVMEGPRMRADLGDRT